MIHTLWYVSYFGTYPGVGFRGDEKPKGNRKENQRETLGNQKIFC